MKEEIKFPIRCRNNHVISSPEEAEQIKEIINRMNIAVDKVVKIQAQIREIEEKIKAFNVNSKQLKGGKWVLPHTDTEKFYKYFEEMDRLKMEYMNMKDRTLTSPCGRYGCPELGIPPQINILHEYVYFTSVKERIKKCIKRIELHEKLKED